MLNTDCLGLIGDPIMQVFAIENGFLLIIQGGVGEISKAIYAKTEVDIGNEIIAEQARRVLEIEKTNSTKLEPELDLSGVQDWETDNATKGLADEIRTLQNEVADDATPAPSPMTENFAEQTGRRKIRKLFETPHSRGC
jgi:hypothetical protein